MGTYLQELVGGYSTAEETREARDLVRELYDAFDTDGNGVVDWVELGAGLTVLCSGSRRQKVRLAFYYFDANSDGFLSPEEMARYLVSVYRILYVTVPGHMIAGVSAEELGEITAMQCFVDADLNGDGHLSFAEFEQWYS